MATKKIQIEFDLNTNEVKLAGEATLSLAQQVKILQRELQKTPEGTKEFELLRRKLNDTRDNFDRVNAKSRELFGTLSLIPGPIGEIAGKVNGAISLLKTFSGFSFKDLRNQFNGLVDDIKNIFTALGSWGESSKDLIQDQDSLSDSTNELNNATAAQVKGNVQAAKANKDLTDTLKENNDVKSQAIAAQKNYLGGLQAQRAALQSAIQQQGGFNKATQEQKTQLASLNSQILKGTTDLNVLTQSQNTNTTSAQKNAVAQTEVGVSSKIATTSTTQQTIATRALTIAQNQAIAAGRLLKGILATLGIGALIFLVTTLVSKFINWVKSTEAVDKANQDLIDTLQFLNRVLEDNLALVDEEVQKNVLRAKAAGKTQKEIFDIESKGIQDRIALLKKGQEDLFNELSSPKFLQLTKEQQKEREKEIIDARNKLQKQIEQLESQGRIDEVKFESQKQEQLRAEREKAADKEKERRQQDLENRKKELDAAIQLEINKANTDEKILKDLLDKRLELEKLSGNQLLLAQEENRKKLSEAVEEDFEKERQDKLKRYDTLVEIEKSREVVDTERLIAVLTKRREIELQQEGLTYDEKQAIILKSEAEIRELRQDAREQQLVEDIDANRGNFEKQIELYRQFAQEVLSSEEYTAAEKLKIVEETNARIEQLEQERVENEKTRLDLSLQEGQINNQKYFNELISLYDKEIEALRLKYLRQEIIEIDFNKRLKALTDARNKIKQDEVDTQIKLVEAIGNGFGALSNLVGEQTRQGKALAVAATFINTYAAIAAQLRASSSSPGAAIPGYAIAQAIATGIFGIAQVRKILSTPVPSGSSSGSGGVVNQGVINVTARRAQGGIINGTGGEFSDNIPALLSNGEFVMNSRSTRVFRPLLESMNSAANLPAFAVGGLVGGGQPTPFKSQNETIADAISTAFGQTPIRTYVTATDVTTQQQFDRVIKSRSLI